MDRRDFFESLVYHTIDGRRFTQQSPVMPDVWIKYGLDPGGQLELIMVPDWNFTPVELARELKERLKKDRTNEQLQLFRNSDKKSSAFVAYNQNVVVATLCFDELIRAVLPLSSWWGESISQLDVEGEDHLVQHLKKTKKCVSDIASVMGGDEAHQFFTTDMAWFARIAGLLAYLCTDSGRKGLKKISQAEEKQVKWLTRLLPEGKNKGASAKKLAEALVQLLTDIEPADSESGFPLFTVNLNRTTSNTLHYSVASIKADATWNVFDVKGKNIRWAVVDSGIDAEHIAFRKRRNGKPETEPFSKRVPGRRKKSDTNVYNNNTRIKATYDFVYIRELLGVEPDKVNQLDKKKFPILQSAAKRKQLATLLKDFNEYMIDWSRLEPFLEVPHKPVDREEGTKESDSYRRPVNRHGTHVAGIIAANWLASDEDEDNEIPAPSSGQDLIGICPEIELYDLRVLDHEGKGNEFAIMSALQFVRDLNTRKDFVAIHGVNLSFSIKHDVANYACGRTPVCDEAERLVGSGITVVAAAGNSGRARYVTPAGLPDDGFRTVSITDPGNAESVITVGSTHRSDAHTYGVSYFSSRGPTGDGRLKPDLVAPGEKIRSTIPGNADDLLDGTSMSAPHVSGAAALILTRHTEFIGQPRRIKEILCETATDLGRERYFQGSGLLDILRALQSI